MEYRHLGKSGLQVSVLGLGTDNFCNPTPEKESAEILERALDAGINLVDTGNSYARGEGEAMIGRALRQSGRRDEVVLATKAHYPTGPGPNRGGNSRIHLMQACEDSLRRLQTDCIDLYQLHRPSPHIPLEETLGALSDLVRQGKVRYIGCSTHPAWMVMKSLLVSERKHYEGFISEQSPYNLLDRRIENEMVPMCQQHGVGLLAWSPMAMGMLAGRYDDESNYPTASRAAQRGGIYAERINAKGIAVGRQFSALAAEVGLPPSQLAVLWVKEQPGITAPLIGPRTLEQLESMLPVADMKLEDATRAACDALVRPGAFAANFHNSAPWMKRQDDSE